MVSGISAEESLEAREEALLNAARSLGPFPWGRLRVQKHGLDRGRIFPSLRNTDEAKRVCEKLAWQYAARQEEEKISLRPAKLISNVEGVSKAGKDLAARFRKLHPEEKQFLAGALRPDRPEVARVIASQQELRLNHYEGLVPYGWRDRIGRIERLIVELEAFSQETRETIRLWKTDFRFAGENDRGGKVTIYQRFKAPSMWWLVRQCWMLFASSRHLTPSATADGPLHTFLGLLHEAATGEDLSGTSRFKSTLTRFANTLRERDTAFDALAAIARRGKVSIADFNATWDQRFLEAHFRNPEDVNEAVRLQDIIHRAQLTIASGPVAATRSGQRK